MLPKTSGRGVALSLAAALLAAASAACSPASASPSTPKTTGMSPRSTTARPTRSPETTSPGTLSALAGRLVFTRSPSPATSSRLYSPVGVAVGPHGDLFIADSGSYRRGGGHPRREAVGRRGGRQRGATDARPCHQLRADWPRRGGGGRPRDLFIADQGNSLVEEVTPAGRLSVVAGVAGKSGRPAPGPATSSELDWPTGVAVDAHGDLFIADTENDVVEEVTPAGRLSVVAG